MSAACEERRFYEPSENGAAAREIVNFPDWLQQLLAARFSIERQEPTAEYPSYELMVTLGCRQVLCIIDAQLLALAANGDPAMAVKFILAEMAVFIEALIHEGAAGETGRAA